MKIRSREINIFSMSALDLFASAMGAFMLLAIIALPYFPHTGDSVELVAEVKEQLEQAQEELEETKEELEVVSQELVKVKIPDLDIVICLDITGSMGEQLAQLKVQINDLALILDRLAPSVGIGIIAFGDREYELAVLTQQDIVQTTSLDIINDFVDNLSLGIGSGSFENPGDPPDEAIYLALEAATDMSWRRESQRRYVIVITDAPAYPDRRDDSIRLAQNFSSIADQFVTTVMVNRNIAESFLVELSSAGGGAFVDSTSGQSMLASLILAIVGI